MGKLYDLIQEHIDNQPYGVSLSRIAQEIGVTPTTLTNWREPKRLIKKEHLLSIARVTRNPFYVVRDALLEDIGYASPTPTPPQDDPGRGEVGDDDRSAAS